MRSFQIEEGQGVPTTSRSQGEAWSTPSLRASEGTDLLCLDFRRLASESARE